MPEDREHTTVEQAGSDGSDDGGANPVTPAQGVGQAGSQGVQPVPAPGHRDSSAGAGVRTAQGASPEDGIEQDDKSPGSDASVTSPGAWTAIAAPGAPDGEVDTRP
jgi:hypothetical protein